MKYKKGTFVIIPNIQYLKGKPPFLQTIFFWIVQHTDETGICYPSRERLAKECGCDVRSIDRWIKVLEADGVIKKTKRKKPKSKENASNVYQVILVDKIKTIQDFNTLPSDNVSSLGSDTNIPITISNNNYIQVVEQPKVVEEVPEFSFVGELNKLKESKWKPNKIIYLYWTYKKFKFTNKKQFDSAVKREIRPAKALEGYNATEITKTMEFCDEKYYNVNWTLETVGKSISSVVNKKD